MSPKTRYVAAVLGLAFAASFAIAAPSTSGAVSALDSEGRSISLKTTATRIVSLSPAITETLFAIGAGGAVVGVTTYCDFPSQALALPKVGGFSAKTISVEKIIALKPDLVVSSGSIHKAVEESLARLGVAVFSYAPDTFADIARDMSALGSLSGTRESAERSARAMIDTIASIAATLASVKAGDRPSVFWEIYEDPLMTAGSATFQHSIVEAGGGRDIFSDLPGSWPRVSAEEVLRRAPAYIMGADDHGDKMSVAQIAARPGWSNVPAVRDGRIVLIPASIVSRPSPRIAQGVLAVAKALYPGLFGR